MGRCKKCGKSGLFLRVNSKGLCSYCAENEKLIMTDVKKYLYKTEASYRKATDELEQQDKLLKVALKARDQYKIDGDWPICIRAVCSCQKEWTPPAYFSPFHSQERTHYLESRVFSIGSSFRATVMRMGFRGSFVILYFAVFCFIISGHCCCNSVSRLTCRC